MTVAVILAAGASTRLGTPKQLVVFEDETLLDRAVRIASEAGCSPVIVVLGANAEEIQRTCALRNAVVILNEDWPEGMGSSLRTGVAEVKCSDGAVVMTCDMVSVTPGHLRTLIASGTLIASRYADRNGVPAYFPRSSFEALFATTGDAGARSLLRTASSIDLAEGDFDIDTPADVARLVTLSSKPRSRRR